MVCNVESARSSKAWPLLVGLTVDLTVDLRQIMESKTENKLKMKGKLGLWKVCI